MAFFRALSSLASSTVSKSPLAVLRKRTGYPIGKCKDALQRHDNDLSLAEKWMKEQALREGWAKAEQLAERAARQGLIGVVARDNQAAIVEVRLNSQMSVEVLFSQHQVNCETDFVSRNEGFRSFLSQVVDTVVSTAKPTPSPLQHLSTAELKTLVPPAVAAATSDRTYFSLSDLVAETIGHFSENVALRRAAVMLSSRGKICSFAYNAKCDTKTGVAMGTYGCLVHLVPSEGDVFACGEDSVLETGRLIGQHIVGMSPTQVHPHGDGDSSDRGDSSDGVSRVLIEQPYLLDQTVTVREWLKSRDTQVTGFVRFALGETSSQ